MNTYETLDLITATVQVGGNAFMDTLSVIFALMITGYVAGPKLTRRMVWGMVMISALFVLPMIGVILGTFGRVRALGNSLPRDQFAAMPYLEAFADAGGPVVGSVELSALVMVVAMAALYAGAVFFVFHCHSKGTVTANS